MDRHSRLAGFYAFSCFVIGIAFASLWALAPPLAALWGSVACTVLVCAIASGLSCDLREP